jgi:hypothetical protein
MLFLESKFSFLVFDNSKSPKKRFQTIYSLAKSANVCVRTAKIEGNDLALGDQEAFSKILESI